MAWLAHTLVWFLVDLPADDAAHVHIPFPLFKQGSRGAVAAIVVDG
jgi:hypothetical protein